jgi:hypothetical protein
VRDRIFGSEFVELIGKLRFFSGINWLSGFRSPLLDGVILCYLVVLTCLTEMVPFHGIWEASGSSFRVGCWDSKLIPQLVIRTLHIIAAQ